MASIQQTPQGPVLVLKESALQQKGKDAQKNNITAAKLVAELVKSSLGPRGLDKMLVDPIGDVTITNDGSAEIGAYSSGSITWEDSTGHYSVYSPNTVRAFEIDAKRILGLN